MHTVNRSADLPPELVNLANSGGEDFGPLAESLDEAFAGVCAYCERATRDDDPDLNTAFFTCDHFKPRHQLCHHDPAVGQCDDSPPPHSPHCPIYDWDNLVYACRSCADAKGGQWPRPGDSADSYINPINDADAADAPNVVFIYDTDSGRILPRDGINRTARYKAERTIGDLALNDPRRALHQGTRYAARARRINLADLRAQWVKRLRATLDALAANDQEVLSFVIGEYVHTSGRFSSICRQFVQESEYRIYLTPPAQSAWQS